MCYSAPLHSNWFCPALQKVEIIIIDLLVILMRIFIQSTIIFPEKIDSTFLEKYWVWYF